MPVYKMQEEDVTGVRVLGCRLNKVLGKNGGDFWSEQLLNEVLIDKSCACAVAREGKRVVGFAIAFILPVVYVGVILNDLCVEEAYTNKGVRELLVSEIRDQLSKRVIPIDDLMIFGKQVDMMGLAAHLRLMGFISGSPMALFEGRTARQGRK